jgi:hypothetical protein
MPGRAVHEAAARESGQMHGFTTDFRQMEMEEFLNGSA